MHMVDYMYNVNFGNNTYIGGGDGGARGPLPPPPHFYGTLFARKDRDTLIEQSGS